MAAYHIPSTFSVDPLLTTEEAAALITCAPATLDLDRCRRRWKVPFIKVGRLVRYRRSEVLAWLEARTAGTGGA